MLLSFYYKYSMQGLFCKTSSRFPLKKAISFSVITKNNDRSSSVVIISKVLLIQISRSFILSKLVFRGCEKKMPSQNFIKIIIPR